MNGIISAFAHIISFEFSLSLYTQEFSLAVIRSSQKTTCFICPRCLHFACFSLFNLQGTRRFAALFNSFAASAANSFTLSHSQAFVKHFFRFFRISFEIRFFRFSFWRSLDCLCILAKSEPFVKHVFSFFSISFSG